MSVLEKICVTCGRSFGWRRKWARDWEQVRYCSDACRRSTVGEIDVRLERAILELLATRDRGATICPSEAARRVDPSGWRELMERTRRAARRLVAGGKVVIKQRGHVVDASRARGPLRIGRA
jgi:hypothetical protein